MIPFVGFIAGIAAAVLLWGDHRALAWLAIGLAIVQTVAGWKVEQRARKEQPAPVWSFIGMLTIPTSIILCIYALFA